MAWGVPNFDPYPYDSWWIDTLFFIPPLDDPIDLHSSGEFFNDHPGGFV